MSDEPTQKIIDTKLPLTWLIGTAAVLVTSYAVLFAKVDRMVSDVALMQGMMQARDASFIQTQRDVAILQFRVDVMDRAAQSERVVKAPK